MIKSLQSALQSVQTDLPELFKGQRNTNEKLEDHIVQQEEDMKEVNQALSNASETMGERDMPEAIRSARAFVLG
jgi:hypothetical protein